MGFYKRGNHFFLSCFQNSTVQLDVQKNPYMFNLHIAMQSCVNTVSHLHQKRMHKTELSPEWYQKRGFGSTTHHTLSAYNNTGNTTQTSKQEIKAAASSRAANSKLTHCDSKGGVVA
jgi:hypothetical protein